mgnify:FL=1
MEDYPDLPSAMEKFFSLLNRTLEEVVGAVNGNLSMGDNFNAAIQRVTLEHSKEVDVALPGLKGFGQFGTITVPGFGGTPFVRFERASSATCKFVFSAPVPTGTVEGVLFVLGD